MAIQTYQYLGEAGIQKLAEQLFGKVNLRIAERITQTVDNTSTINHVASAKALYDLKVALDAAIATAQGNITAQAALIQANANDIDALEAADVTAAGNLTALETKVTDLENEVAGLTHLTIQTVEGPITGVADPKYDVLYFQRDDDTDTTWMLYICRPPEGAATDPTWVNIGDTEVDLSNYWQKTDIAAMQDALGMHNAEPIPDTTITTLVETAYTNTAVTLTPAP